MQRMSACEGCLHAEDVCIQRMSACEGCLHAEDVCMQRMSACKGCLHAEDVCMQTATDPGLAGGGMNEKKLNSSLH